MSDRTLKAMQRNARGPHWVCWRCDCILDSGDEDCPHCDSREYVAHCNGRCLRCVEGVEDPVVTSLLYDFRSKVGILKMPANCCTDMTHAIALFKRIDKSVSCICTIAGDVMDACYVFLNGRWEVQP